MGVSCSAKCSPSQNEEQQSEPIIQMPSQVQIINQECHSPYLFDISEEELQEKNLVCSICLQIVKHAVVDECGHVFGKNCIRRWIKKSGVCPLSRRPIKTQDLQPQNENRLMVYKLMKPRFKEILFKNVQSSPMKGRKNSVQTLPQQKPDQQQQQQQQRIPQRRITRQVVY